MDAQAIRMRQALEYLVDQRAPAVEPRSFSDLFDRLIWLQSDNGKELLATLSVWLEGQDLYRVKIALGLEEAFLFDSREDMVEAFAKIEGRWPELRGRCLEILDAWDKSVGTRAKAQ